jgi:hypothetical protein
MRPDAMEMEMYANLHAFGAYEIEAVVEENRRAFEAHERKRKARIYKWHSRGFPWGNGFANGLTLLAFAIVSAIISWKIMERAAYVDYQQLSAEGFGQIISLLALAAFMGIWSTLQKVLGLTMFASLCIGIVVWGVYTSTLPVQVDNLWVAVILAIFDSSAMGVGAMFIFQECFFFK